jgi:acyl carrier protein
MSTENKIIELISKTTDNPIDDISLDSNMDNTSGWDSIKHLEIIAEIENWIGRELSLDEIVHITSVQDLINTLNKVEKNCG